MFFSLVTDVFIFILILIQIKFVNELIDVIKFLPNFNKGLLNIVY